MTRFTVVTRETPVGVWLWPAMLVGFAVQVAAIDVWLHRHGFEFLTSEFREGLDDVVAGPIITGLSAGVVSGLAYHFYHRPQHSR